MAKGVSSVVLNRAKKVTSIGHSVRSKPNQNKNRVKKKYRGQGK